MWSQCGMCWNRISAYLKSQVEQDEYELSSSSMLSLIFRMQKHIHDTGNLNT